MQTANSLSVTLVLALLAAIPCLAALPAPHASTTSSAPAFASLPPVGGDRGA